MSKCISCGKEWTSGAQCPHCGVPVLAVDPPKVDDKERGLYKKYRVSRLDDVEGKHNDCLYFVLDLDHDPFAIPALAAYINSCRDEYPVLAFDLAFEIAKRGGGEITPTRTHDSWDRDHE